MASKRTFKCECILIGGGPEGEEGQEGPFWERKEHKQREGHGEKKRKQFGLGREQGPRKVVAEKAGKRARLFLMSLERQP